MGSMRRVAHAVTRILVIAATVIMSGSSPASAVCAAEEDTPKVTPDVVFAGAVESRTGTTVTFQVDTVYRGSAFETETLHATEFADDPLAYVGPGDHAVVEGDSDPFTGRISVPTCARFDSSSWSEADGHPPATGMLGRLRTHPVSGFTALLVIGVLSLILIGRAIWKRIRPRVAGPTSSRLRATSP
jgi:hypothetical protein